MTPEDKQKMFDRQNGLCKICGELLERALVDHCHVTNKVRGLLCQKCNSGLGMFRDRIDSLKQAIRYLEESRLVAL
jgi:Recombination endonuclease VII